MNGDRSVLYWGLPVCVVVFMLLASCGDAASCWNHIKARATSCEQMRLDEINHDRANRESKR